MSFRASKTSFRHILVHNENTPIQIYTENCTIKNESFRINSDVFHICTQNIHCGYSLEPPHGGDSYEYPQSVFLSRNKIMYTIVNLSFTIQKWGLRGSKLYRYVLVMCASDQSKTIPLWIASFYVRLWFHMWR